MIWYYLILFITSLLNAVFSFLPKIEALPTILGVNVDQLLVLGVGYFLTFADSFWMIGDVFTAALIIYGYKALMMVLRFFIGHRAPV